MSRSGLFPNRISKSEAARIAHEYLKAELGEKDEEDVAAAGVLKDLYDCHTCVAHIAQVYVKGIMTPKSRDEFGNRDILTEDELERIEERLFDRSKRLHVENVKSICRRIGKAEISGLDQPVIIDVRDAECFNAGHMDGAVNIPLEKIRLNPRGLSRNLFSDIVFVCDYGTRACLAADTAAASGYRNVYYAALNE